MWGVDPARFSSLIFLTAKILVFQISSTFLVTMAHAGLFDSIRNACHDSDFIANQVNGKPIAYIFIREAEPLRMDLPFPRKDRETMMATDDVLLPLYNRTFLSDGIPSISQSVCYEYKFMSMPKLSNSILFRPGTFKLKAHLNIGQANFTNELDETFEECLQKHGGSLRTNPRCLALTREEVNSELPDNCFGKNGQMTDSCLRSMSHDIYDLRVVDSRFLRLEYDRRAQDDEEMAVDWVQLYQVEVKVFRKNGEVKRLGSFWINTFYVDLVNLPNEDPYDYLAGFQSTHAIPVKRPEICVPSFWQKCTKDGRFVGIFDRMFENSKEQGGEAEDLFQKKETEAYRFYLENNIRQAVSRLFQQELTEDEIADLMRAPYHRDWINESKYVRGTLPGATSPLGGQSGGRSSSTAPKTARAPKNTTSSVAKKAGAKANTLKKKPQVVSPSLSSRKPNSRNQKSASTPQNFGERSHLCSGKKGVPEQYLLSESEGEEWRIFLDNIISMGFKEGLFGFQSDSLKDYTNDWVRLGKQLEARFEAGEFDHLGFVDKSTIPNGFKKLEPHHLFVIDVLGRTIWGEMRSVVMKNPAYGRVVARVAYNRAHLIKKLGNVHPHIQTTIDADFKGVDEEIILPLVLLNRKQFTPWNVPKKKGRKSRALEQLLGNLPDGKDTTGIFIKDSKQFKISLAIAIEMLFRKEYFIARTSNVNYLHFVSQGAKIGNYQSVSFSCLNDEKLVAKKSREPFKIDFEFLKELEKLSDSVFLN